MSPSELRTRMRTDLVAAMKARRPEVVAALRTTIAALDNAEAIAAPTDTASAGSSEHVAGASAGAGSTEAARRALTGDEVHAIVQAQIEDRTAEADRYDALGQVEAATRLRREADILRAYVASN